jgi:IS30 family transposase
VTTVEESRSREDLGSPLAGTQYERDRADRGKGLLIGSDVHQASWWNSTHKPLRRSVFRLSLAEREEISRVISAKDAFAIIAERIGRQTSTLSPEVAANGGRGEYRASCRAARSEFGAPRRRNSRSLPGSKKKRGHASTNGGDCSKIAATLRGDFPDDPEMWISHEATYHALFLREWCAFPADSHRLLRTGRPRRRARRGTKHEQLGRTQAW